MWIRHVTQELTMECPVCTTTSGLMLGVVATTPFYKHRAAAAALGTIPTIVREAAMRLLTLRPWVWLQIPSNDRAAAHTYD